ncbi:MAG: hypothetical protein K6D59_08790 [Bacteroidales bacterium]|nr:hypothetical protein [Bacteroidales bacterium]
MKKYIYYMFWMLIWAMAYSQNSVIVDEPSFHGPTIKTLIKEYHYPVTISCVSTDYGSATFILSDSSMQTVERTVEKLRVEDMSIVCHGNEATLYDTLFFCGFDNTGLAATIGFFNIHDFFYGSGNVQIHSAFGTFPNGGNVFELTRLETYPAYDGSRHVVCIGKTTSSLSCIVDLSDDMFGIWGYQSGYIADHLEHITDIKFVTTNIDSYLVTAGFNDQFGKYLNIRIYDPDNIFSSSGPQNTRHVFCIDTAFTDEWMWNDILLAKLHNNYFATVSYKTAHNQDFLQKDYEEELLNYLHLGIYDIPAILGGSLSGMAGNYLTEAQGVINNRLMQFISRNGSDLAFLQQIRPYPSGNSYSVFCELKITNNTILSGHSKYLASNYLFQGMDLYDSSTRYVMGGYNNSNAYSLNYEMETFWASKQCAELDEYKWNKRTPYRSINSIYGFETIAYLSNFTERESILYKVPLTIICSDDE